MMIMVIGSVKAKVMHGAELERFLGCEVTLVLLGFKRNIIPAYQYDQFILNVCLGLLNSDELHRELDKESERIRKVIHEGQTI